MEHEDGIWTKEIEYEIPLAMIPCEQSAGHFIQRSMPLIYN